MGKKQSFTEIRTERVGGTLETALSHRGQQGVVSKEEAEARAAAMKTQGRKGCKASRINMAFTPENLDFIKAGASLYHMTMTQFCNRVIAAYSEEHPQIKEKGNAFRAEVQSGELPEL